MIELVGEERIGQLAKVHLEKRRDRVHVVHVDLLLDLGELLFVERVAQLLYIRLQTSVTIDAVHDAVLLDELRAYGEYFGHVLLGVAQVLAEIAGEHALLDDAL